MNSAVSLTVMICLTRCLSLFSCVVKVKIHWTVALNMA